MLRPACVGVSSYFWLGTRSGYRLIKKGRPDDGLLACNIYSSIARLFLVIYIILDYAIVGSVILEYD